MGACPTTRSTSFQPGGTAIVALNEWAHQATSPGNDMTSLGHWSWVRILGHDNHHLWIVTVYQPCKSNGHLMMYQQQVCRRLSTTGCSVCPRKKLLEDLHNQVTQWQSNGDSIIIMGDMNEDIWEDPVLSVATNMGVTDAVTTQHGNQSPNTHNRGSMPIDGIFLPTNLIQTIQSGYLAFSEGIPSNHRVIWVDIPVTSLGCVKQCWISLFTFLFNQMLPLYIQSIFASKNSLLLPLTILASFQKSV